MSKLIVSGCSYTDNIWIDSHGFTPWPEKLAEKLGMECINLGASGAGNEYVMSSLMDRLFEKDIGLMIAMWTQPARMDFPCFGARSAKGWVHVHMNGNEHLSNWKYKIRGTFRQYEIGSFSSLAEKSMRLYYIFQLMMEMHDIPYFQIQGCKPCWGADEHVFLRGLLKGKFTDKMNENTFIGWPIMSELGGTWVDQILDEIDPERVRFRISESDSHPNEKGHKVIVDYFLKEIEKEYGNLQIN